MLNAKASEESMANVARWEPAHGRFNFRHPWKNYLKVGASSRSCAYCIETLTSCLDSKDKVDSNFWSFQSYHLFYSNSKKYSKEILLIVNTGSGSNKEPSWFCMHEFKFKLIKCYGRTCKYRKYNDKISKDRYGS